MYVGRASRCRASATTATRWAFSTTRRKPGSGPAVAQTLALGGDRYAIGTRQMCALAAYVIASSVHTYIRLRGYGYGIVPYAPYLIRRIGDGLDGSVSIEARGHRAYINPHRLEVAETLADVADVHQGPGPDEWLIDSGSWAVVWPNEFSLASPETDDTPFVLHGRHGLIWVQGPFSRLPDDDDLLAPGRRVVARGDEDGFRWLEVEYGNKISSGYSDTTSYPSDSC